MDSEQTSEDGHTAGEDNNISKHEDDKLEKPSEIHEPENKKKSY